ncbi:urease accessory protein UreE [Rhodopila sp.]|uniref:urease accessory protein UreE n=1 Tax=Rhodopila sp. TaxID=2480087 RepID=UPI003D11B42B
MLRLHGLVGNERDTALHERLHKLEHAGAVEHVFVDDSEVGRRRFRLDTDRGTDCAISLDRDQALVNGAVLLLEPSRAIIVRIGTTKVWRLRARNQDAALQLGWNAGNLHWRVRFETADLLVLLDGPVDDYRARIQPLLAAGLVDEVDAA